MSHTVASLVADALIANDIDQLYCLPGVQNDDFFDCLYDRQNRLNPVHARHEQGAAYMALGAALATGMPQAFAVVPGPGFLNTTAALSTAYGLNAPVLALAGQIPLGAIGKGYGLLHEIPDQLTILRGLTKQAARIEGGGNALAAVSSAFTALQSGRPRPVGIEVPVDVWKADIASIPETLRFGPRRSPEIDAGKIAEAGRILNRAKRPVIFVGGGAQHCSEAVTRLAETLSAPVVAFRTGHGVVSSRHALSAGMPVGHALWRRADAVLAIGTRLQIPQMQWGVDDDMAIIHIDIDVEEPGRISPPAVALHGDAEDAVTALLGVLEKNAKEREDWRETLRETKTKFAKIYNEQLAPQMAWLDAIRAELPEDGLLVDELTQMGYVARFAFPVYRPRTFLSTGYQGTLGWGLAAAMGAAHARRDVPVVAISGDGGALYTISELATAVRHNIPLTAIIFNDNAFGNVRRFQIEKYHNRPIASDLASPDFVKLADSFGAQGLRAETPDALRARLREAFKHDGPSVIEVPVGTFPSPWPFIVREKVRGL